MSNLVMYLRLSLEDDVNADESNSITNQRRIIRDYISSHEDLRSMTVTEKCDDGYSGTNMNRPGMQELLAMVKEQRVDCIIVKDDCVIIEPTQKDLENQGFVAGSICF